jgi:hypothetical protein
MLDKYFEVKITETVSDKSNPEDPRDIIINKKSMRCRTKEDVKDYLKEQYGKVPAGKNKIYVDGKDGEAIEVGFTHTHNGLSGRQTDWVEILEVGSKRALLKDLK